VVDGAINVVRAPSAEALFATADEVEAAIRTWREAPTPVRESVEAGLYEAAELIRKTARAVRAASEPAT